MRHMDGSEKGGSSENRRKRLLFRAQRRGFKEVDLIFGAYAEAALTSLDGPGLDQFEALLKAPDQEVYAWLRGAEPVPAEYDNPVFAGLKAVCGRKGYTWKG
ncbi:MAG TPA: succinate dehydrogenase assembly factor 2 [Rhizomicrobium sp.]|nr:succinate dehydrogenase assembly factor 2 [Rhizomicrobium sp.]